MKTKIYIWTIIACAFAFTGCESFLEEHPKDQMPEDVAYADPTLVYLNTVANLYTQVGGGSGGWGLGGTDRGIYDLNTFSADEAMLPTRGGDWYDGGLWQNIFLHNWGTKNDLVKSSWGYLYSVIGRCNQSIQRLEELKAEQPDMEHFGIYLAEVRAFRAMYYYYLLDMFARVPIVTSPDIPMADVVQSERSAVFKFVKEELEASIPLLNTAHSNLEGEYYGRITQPVAYFLMAKIALNAEIYTDDNWTDNTRPDGKNIKFTVDGAEKNAWEATAAYCDKITALGYELGDFAANFAVKNETSVENIFVIPMDPTLFTARMMYLVRSRHYEHGKAYTQDGWNGASATKEALTVFGYGTAQQDPRFDLTYYAGKVQGPDGKFIKNGEVDLEYIPSAITLDLSSKPDEKTAGARMKKYALDANAQAGGQLQGNDYVLFRYADVLLMKCEALVRNGGNGTDLLNQLRSARGATTDRTATLDNILAERLLELAWEGHRRQDLVRFGQFTKAITDRPATGSFTTVFPIDEDILSLNSQLTQNHGY